MKEPEFKIGDMIYFLKERGEIYPLYDLSALLDRVEIDNSLFICKGKIKGIHTHQMGNNSKIIIYQSYDIHQIERTNFFWD